MSEASAMGANDAICDEVLSSFITRLGLLDCIARNYVHLMQPIPSKPSI